MDAEPLTVSVRGAKRHLGDVSTATVYRLIQRGRLQKKKIAGRTVITMSSIRALLEAA